MTGEKKGIYEVSGFYKFGDRYNFFTGEFEIGNDNLIRGKIWDPNSRCFEHQVEGEVKQKDNGSAVILNFVKIPTGMLINIFYYFKKTAAPINELAGEYDGHWSFRDAIIPIVKGTEGETGNESRIALK